MSQAIITTFLTTAGSSVALLVGALKAYNQLGNLSFNRLARLRETYKFAKEVHKDSTEGLPSDLIQVGYLGLYGEKLKQSEVNYLKSQSSRYASIENYVFAYKYLQYEENLDHRYRRICLSQKYKLKARKYTLENVNIRQLKEVVIKEEIKVLKREKIICYFRYVVIGLPLAYIVMAPAPIPFVPVLFPISLRILCGFLFAFVAWINLGEVALIEAAEKLLDKQDIMSSNT
jgi:hypothetical protein